MKKFSILAAFCLLITVNLFSQSTTLTLPTSDNTSSFNVTNNSSTNLFKVDGTGKAGIKQTTPRAELEIGGTDGLLVTGTFNNGTLTSLGAGTRMHWYPRRSAFRVGTTDGAWWDDDGTGISNMGYNSIAMGYRPRASGSASVAIGAENWALNSNCLALGYKSQATGASSICIGYMSVASGEASIAIGSYTYTNNCEGAVVIGDHAFAASTYASQDNELTMRFWNGYRLYTSIDHSSGVTMAHNANSWSSVSDSTRKENLVLADGEYFLNSLSQLKLGSWNYKTQNPQQFRHYGPMAQEIFHYFGKDEFGAIGNDTTLASADMDGIMMICLQALEKRTEQFKTELAENESQWKLANKELRQENKQLKNELAALQEVKEANELLQKKVADMENSFNELMITLSEARKESKIELTQK